jgi:large subunit ribosomal protein L29
MKATEIRELSTKELEEKLQNEVDLLNRMKLNHAITPLENPNKIKESRKRIARLYTVLKERELNK